MKINYLIKLTSLVLIGITICQLATAQDTLKILDVNEIVISADRFGVNKSETAQQITTIKANQIAFQNSQTTADLLQQSGTVMVQKSQMGGGSPMLRGFESSRILLVVDGVRMNNLIYRAGHLQNVITLDQSILDRVEVLNGPASTVYGSDALGGVIHFRTKAPQLSQKTDGSIFTKTNAYVRYGSVNDEKTGHVDFNLGWKRFAWLSSVTYSDFDNLTMGKNKQALDSLWGLKKFYVQRFNGKDSLVANSDPYKQKFSGYSQCDILQKFLFQQNSNVTHTLNIQYSNSSNIPRYDRLTDVSKSGGLATAEWYYGPQERLLAAYEINIANKSRFFQSSRVNINYQNVEESRFTRNFGSAFRSARTEKVDVLGGTFDLKHTSEKSDLSVGFEAFHNTVNSTAFAVNVDVDTTRAQSTRYPDGDNSLTTIAAYLTHTLRISNKLTLVDGIRLQQHILNSNFDSKQFYPFPFSEIQQNPLGWSGNLGLIYRPSNKVKLSILSSTGFRAPNVDDLSKVFDSRKGVVVVPNPDIKPEQTYNLEFGGSIALSNNWLMDFAVFSTAFRNAIVVDKFRFNGQDSIVYDGVNSEVLAPQNKREANIYGFSIGTKAQIFKGLTVNANVNYQKGEIINAGANGPLDHIPPSFGNIGLQYSKSKFDVSINAQISAWKRIEDYLLNAEDNEVYATKDGMPSWYVINLRGSYSLTNNIKLQAGIENLLDTNYRIFASGIHAPGRNIYFVLRASF